MKENLLKKENNNLSIINDYKKIVSDILYEKFWEEATPVNKLLKATDGSTKLHYDNWTERSAFKGIDYAHKKRWLAGITPIQLLDRTIQDSVSSIMTLSENNDFTKTVPKQINTPDYGDNWGRSANYIEINNRAIAKQENGHSTEGILSAIKLLPAIPPSAISWANCIILSQVFPNIYGDGYVKEPWEENSLYGIKLNAGYSDNIISHNLSFKGNTLSAEDQIRAFNDLAHFRRLKTGFRMLISEDQIKIAQEDLPDENFRWENPQHVELFINEGVKVLNLGFDSIFFDSLKHVNGHEWHFYTGVGKTPSYEQMQYIFYELRNRSNKTDLSFIGERCDWDIDRYKNMGLTAGTAWGDADDYENIKYWSDYYKYSREYSAGPEVSNDNDEGWANYEQRANRLKSCLFGYTNPSDKLPSFMQMHDLFPLRYDTNTHHLMMSNPSYSQDGTPQSHWKNLFAFEDGETQNFKVGEIFAYALNM